jgi:hypothetical protein
VGFQFGGFFRGCQQIYKFAAMGSNEMTSRSGQERETSKVR